MKFGSLHTVTGTLTPKEASRVEAAVESGSYATPADLMRDALTLLERRENTRNEKSALLKKAYEEGMASGLAPEIDTHALLIELRDERRRV